MQQITESEQIRYPKVSSSAPDGHHRIGSNHARPDGWQRAQPALLILEEHPVLTPGVLVRQQLKLLPAQWMERMGDGENPVGRCATGCSRRRLPSPIPSGQ